MKGKHRNVRLKQEKPKPPSPSAAPPDSTASRSVTTRQLITLAACWLVLAAGLICLASRDTSLPGPYYDEAVFAGMAKDFLTGQPHGQHMVGHEVINLFGRPFPLYVQVYLGAVKSWLLLPALGVFGSSQAVVRLTSVCWGLFGLLLFMLWTWRWLGLSVALAAGTILALDPTFFFITLFDWGSSTPSFLCRFASFFMVFLWWHRQQARYAFLAGLFAGVGFFNKIDFAVLLAGAGLAGIVGYAGPLRARLRARPQAIGWACLGFLLGAGPMLFNAWRVLTERNGLPPSKSNELAEKLHTMLAMGDGSYFYRLMDAGGKFREMFQSSSPGLGPLSMALGLSSACLIVLLIRKPRTEDQSRTAAFVLLAAILISAGTLLVPGAVRIHHVVSVFPFPQLAIATALVFLWRQFSASSTVGKAIRGLLSAGVALFLVSQSLAIGRTQRLIHETGGRGWWSESLAAFCEQVKHRADLTIVSLDWGFNEQLMFLTDGPRLVETLSNPAASLSQRTNCLYLAHPPEYILSPYGLEDFNAAQLPGERFDAEVFCDRQKRPAFYVVRSLGQ